MASNPPKRKPSGPPGSSKGSNKRAKTYDARTLAVQSADAALSATGELDVAAYSAARAFEIQALEEGMKRSKNALTTRAFQKVPRSLRRRTASHNVKRVPRRLRARAQREVCTAIVNMGDNRLLIVLIDADGRGQDANCDRAQTQAIPNHAHSP